MSKKKETRKYIVADLYEVDSELEMAARVLSEADVTDDEARCTALQELRDVAVKYTRIIDALNGEAS